MYIFILLQCSKSVKRAPVLTEAHQLVLITDEQYQIWLCFPLYRSESHQPNILFCFLIVQINVYILPDWISSKSYSSVRYLTNTCKYRLLYCDLTWSPCCELVVRGIWCYTWAHCYNGWGDSQFVKVALSYLLRTCECRASSSAYTASSHFVRWPIYTWYS